MPEKTIDQINRTARDLYQKALAALERNNLDYAIDMFIECLTTEPNFTPARKFLRAAQMKRAESSGGLKGMFHKAKSAPFLTKASMSVSKNPPEAMIYAEKVLSDDPKNGQALQLLAQAADLAGFNETTIQTLEYVLRLSPRDTKSMHWLARTYTKNGQNDLARDTYERILQINPTDFDAQKGIKDATAKGAMQEGKWEEEGNYRKSLKDKEESVTLEQQSRVVRAEDMLDNLIHENLEKLKSDPENPVVRRELGKLYGQKGEFDKAIGILEAILAAEGGTNPTIEKEIAEIKARRVTTQIEAKKKQLLANPGDKALQEEVASLERENDQLQLAETKRLVERYPNDLMYRYELGCLLMKTGNHNEAIDQFQKAVSQPQRRVASLNFLGQCFEQVGLTDLAVDQYIKAIDELPSMDGLKKEIIYNLGNAYDQLGETDKAIAEFKKIAAIDFGFRDVRTRIMRKAPPKT